MAGRIVASASGTSGDENHSKSRNIQIRNHLDNVHSALSSSAAQLVNGTFITRTKAKLSVYCNISFVQSLLVGSCCCL